ncbi:MAG: hypothetical protein HY868_13980 [Chloroflexi bacterium]|nr:hypothetical protein [Chloroflexota bacterium]
MDNTEFLMRLIRQLDALIPFLALSHQDVFDLIQKEKDIWFMESQRRTIPETYEIYCTQVNHSAFLLGYSYFEVFLGDLMKEIFLSNPSMLPKEKQLKFSEILEARTFESVIELMIEKENLALVYQSMDKVIDYFETKLNLHWTDEHKDTIIRATYLRNCIVHNMSRADSRLAQVSQYVVGQDINLTSSEVHAFGLIARALSRDLYRQAMERYFQK